MSPEAQRIAIATACGYEWRRDGLSVCPVFMLDHGIYGTRMAAGGRYGVASPGDSDAEILRKQNAWIARQCPNYLGSLDAMHEAEKWLFERNDWSACTYQDTLQKRVMTSESWTWHATAAQRAEAFLLTLGKWEDDV